MKKNKFVIFSAVMAVMSGLAAIYHMVHRVFFSIAFDLHTKWRPTSGGFDTLPDVSKAGQEWLHTHDNYIVYMTNKEGMKLRGHYFPCEDAKRTLIEFHGWHGSWDVDFSGSSPYMHQAGCNLLLVEQRGQGKSEGSYMTFGVKERSDLQEWVAWYQENIDSDIPIYLAGLSMGATTVLMAAADNFGPQVKGIIADCGFTSPYDIIKKVAKQWFHIPEHPLLDTFNLYCKRRMDVDLKGFSAIDSLEQTKLPVLFVHGKRDNFVPYQMTLAAYDACASDKDILLVDDATHGMSFVYDQDGYIEKILKLFEKYD